MTFDDNGLEVLDSTTCRTLLASTCFGHVALSRQALPIILPVIYTLTDSQILFPAVSAPLRRAATSGDVTCFEADAREADGAMWSVLVVGRLAFVEPTASRLDTRESTNDAEEQLVTVHPSMISGRRTTRALHELRWAANIERSRT